MGEEFKLGHISFTDRDAFQRLIEISEDARRRRIVTLAQVGCWFTKAVGNRGGKKWRPADADVHVNRIVNLLNEQHWFQRRRDRDPVKESRNEIVTQKARAILVMLRKLQPPLRDLQSDLPWLRDIYSRNEPEAQVTYCLSRLFEAMVGLEKVAPYLFDPPAPGRPKETWQIVARSLREPIEVALSATGLSVYPGDDSPIVKVMCRALKAVFGKSFVPDTVARELRGKRSKTTQGKTI
jgi:hypothetical protein